MIDEEGKVVFNEQEQVELDRIVGERLARDRKEVSTEMQELKDALAELDDFGYIGSPAEKREAIKQYKQQLRQQADLEQLEQQAEEDGVTPALAKKMKALEDRLEENAKVIKELTNKEESKKKEAETIKQAEEEWNKQLKEFEEKYPDVDVSELDKNSKFVKFAKGKNGTLKELYTDFVDFIGETEAETIAKIKTKGHRSTSSGKLLGSDGGSTYGLTDNQKNLAKENGMTYKEYAEAFKLTKK